MSISNVAKGVVGVLVLLAGGYVLLRRIGERSGVTDEDIARTLPGDELVHAPHMTADRATVIDAPAEHIWPWLMQLGKARAGWYFPAWLERVLPEKARGAREILPAFQTYVTGDVVPDYGPGEGLFRFEMIEPPHTLVLYSVRRPSENWGWPEEDDPPPDDCLVLSWALLLEDLSEGRSRFYVRLRADPAGRKSFAPWLTPFGWIVDWVTVTLLFAGLRERVASGPRR